MDSLRRRIVVMLVLGLHVGIHSSTKELEQPSLWARAKGVVAIFTDQIKKDLISGGESSEYKPSSKDHLLHGLRLLGYSWSLQCAIRYMRGFLTSDKAYVDPDFIAKIYTSPWFMAYAVFLAPLLEEKGFTYDGQEILGNKAQYIMPIIFGLMHTQYDSIGQVSVGTMNFIHHRSLITRKEYEYGPYIAHVLNNAIAIGLPALLALSQ